MTRSLHFDKPNGGLRVEKKGSRRKQVALQTMAELSRVLRTPLARTVEQMQSLNSSPDAGPGARQVKESLDEKPIAPTNSAESIPEILANLTFLVDLLDSLSELSVPHRHDTTSEFNPGVLVRESIAELGLQFAQAQVEPRVVLSPQLPAMIVGDAVCMKRILKCLVTYVLRSQPSCRLHVECRPEPTQMNRPQCLEIDVYDEHAADLPLHVTNGFKPRSPSQLRADTSTSLGGAGRRITDATQLTLFIAYRILRTA